MSSRNGRAVLLSNPTAGRGDAALEAARAVARLHQLGMDVEHIAGVNREHASELASYAVATRPETFIVAGGDGCVSVAVQALVGTDIPLAIIPTGSGNDTARTLGIPLGDTDRAADIAAAGRTRTVDLGRIVTADGTEQHFIGIAAADYSSDAIDINNRLPVQWPHQSRFIAAALGASPRLSALPFTLTTDDGRDLSGEYFIAAIGNLRTYGAGMAICPGADPRDGLLDITLIRRCRLPLFRLMPYLLQGYTGGVVPDDLLEFHRARSVFMDSPGRQLCADGDPVGPLPAQISCVPQSLRVIVP